MKKSYYIEETDRLLKKVFGKKFVKYSRGNSKKGDIYIYSTVVCQKIVIVSDKGGSISTIFNANSYRELYGYVCGLYDMKSGKIKDHIKQIKNSQ